jgi:predicted nucleotidyltransferase
MSETPQELVSQKKATAEVKVSEMVAAFHQSHSPEICDKWRSLQHKGVGKQAALPNYSQS